MSPPASHLSFVFSPSTLCEHILLFASAPNLTLSQTLEKTTQQTIAPLHCPFLLIIQKSLNMQWLMWYGTVTLVSLGRRGGLQCCWKTAKAAPSLSHAEMDCAFPEGNIQKNLILCHSSSKVLRLGEGGKQTKQAAPYCSEGTMNKQQGQKMKAVFTRSNVRLKTDPVPTRPWVNTRSKLNISIIKTRINYPENKYIYIVVWQIIKLYVKCINWKTVEGHWQLLTYSSQNPSDFAEPSVPPGHAIIIRSGFAGRCCLFGAHCGGFSATVFKHPQADLTAWNNPIISKLSSLQATKPAAD